ncbi:MAG TPA: serine hydrolase domain-containing protein [Paenibacillus cookii]|nr:serine hydrolase domain-containing protein [Paenibacillus cookii]
MNRLNQTIFACFICMMTVLAAAWPSAAGAAGTRSRAEMVSEIDEYVQKNMKLNHIPGPSLAIAKGDGTFYAKGYGTASDGKGITATTPMPIASLSKSMTALAVLQLADLGRIDLDAPYVSYVPDIKPADERVTRITIRHLLNQTSGLNDKTNPDMTRPTPFRKLEEVASSLNRVKLAADPGKTYSYHNPNYQLLALLVERVSGQRFSDYLHDHVFGPLGMKDTFNVSATEQINANPAIPAGHYVLLGKPVAKEEPSWFIGGPAGVVSTAEDMAQWMRAQYDAKLLSPGLLKQYHAAGEQGPYGMGWLASDEPDVGRTISHSGILWTYKSEETIDLDQRLGIAMMFDAGLNAFIDYSAFVRGIADIMAGGKAEVSAVNSRNAETVLMALMAATVLWGGFSLYRQIKHRNRAAMSRRKLIFAAIRALLPMLILGLLSPIVTFIGGGRVLPWQGIWMTLPSVMLWLGLLSLAGIASFVCRCVMYRKTRRGSGISA